MSTLRKIVELPNTEKFRRNPVDEPVPSTPIDKILQDINRDLSEKDGFPQIYAEVISNWTDAATVEDLYEKLLGQDYDKTAPISSYRVNAHTKIVVESLLDILPKASKYNPAIRFLIYYLLCTGFYKETILFGAFASYNTVEATQKLPRGLILNSVSVAVALLLKDVCVFQRAMTKGKNSTQIYLEGINRAWDIPSIAMFDNENGETFEFENAISQELFNTHSSLGLHSGTNANVCHAFKMALGFLHPHSIAGYFSSLGYLFYLKKRNDNIVEREKEFLKDVISSKYERFVGENKFSSKTDLDPKQFFSYQGDPETENEKISVEYVIEGKGGPRTIKKEVTRGEHQRSQAITSYNK